MIAEGDVVVAELPQADGATKPRPVLLLRQLPGFGDFLTCGISAQVHQAQPKFDLILQAGDKSFDSTGLKRTSVIRLGFLASIPRNQMTRRLGQVTPGTLETLQSHLASHLVKRHKAQPTNR